MTLAGQEQAGPGVFRVFGVVPGLSSPETELSSGFSGGSQEGPPPIEHDLGGFCGVAVSAARSAAVPHGMAWEPSGPSVLTDSGRTTLLSSLSACVFLSRATRVLILS